MDEHSIDWIANVDGEGRRSFLLPGEKSIDSATMRRRTKLYYAQVRRAYDPRQQQQRASKRRIAQVLAFLDDLEEIP